MLETGILLLFLVPGLAAYAAVYGIFHSGKAIAPEPPSANTVEAVIVIAGASLLVHLLSAAAFAINGAACDGGCPVTVPAAWTDPYGSALRAMAGQGISGQALALALGGVAIQGAATYAAVRYRLVRLARRDHLPAWIYGWATFLADALDNADTAVIAYVLTTSDAGDRALAYGGLVHDIALRSDGAITRITLTDCERYLVDLTSCSDEASLSDALSRFSFMVIDAAQIRNVAFETIHLDVIAPPPG